MKKLYTFKPESSSKSTLTTLRKGGLANSMIFRCSPLGLGVKHLKIIEFYTFRSWFRIAISILFLFACEVIYAQIPAGGTMLNVTTGTTYRNVGSGTLTQVTVTGQPFTKAIRYVTGTNVLNFWDTQIQFPSATGIAENDVILIAFYARTISSVEEGGEGAVNVVIEHGTTYAKEI